MSGMPPTIGSADILMDVQDNNLDNQLLGGDWSGGGGTGQVYAPTPAPTPAPAQPPTPAAPPSNTGFNPVPGAKPLRATFGQPAPAQPTAPAGVSQPQTYSMPGFEPLPGAKPISIAWGSPPQAQQNALGDFGKELWAGLKQAGEAAVGGFGGLERATSGINQDILNKAAEYAPSLKPLTQLYGMGRTLGLQQVENARQALKASAASTIASMSPDAQAAMRASIFGKGTPQSPTPGQVGVGEYLSSALASAMPDVGVVVASTLLGNPELATPLISGWFGVTGAGQAYNQAVDTINKLSNAQLMQVPAYKAAIDRGESSTQARADLAGRVGLTLVPLAAGIGAATGGAGGRLATRGPFKALSRGFLGRMGVGAVEGAGIGAAQAGGQNVLEQGANLQLGVQKTFDPTETAEAVASGLLGGGVMGGAFGVIPHAPEHATPENDETVPVGEVGEVGDDEGAALTNALPAPEKLPLLEYHGPTLGEGFQLSPEGTPAVPTEKALPGPPELAALEFNPDRTQGEGTPWTSTGEGMIPGQGGFTTRSEPQTVPERPEDIKAQVQALLDPDSTKDAVFVPKGTRMPNLGKALPDGVRKIVRPEGTLLTTNTAKAALFRKTPDLNDTVMAHILGYPETRPQAAASGQPRVVQARNPEGNIVAEMAASPEGETAARAAAAAQAPGGRVETTTPEQAVAERTDIHPIPLERPVEEAAQKAAVPTEAQAEAGNYQKGHLNLQGLDISIETPKGAVRRGKGWQTIMPGHYGYIRKTAGADGEHVDVTLGPRAEQMHDMPADAADHEPVFVVDQVDPATGKFDEHKAFVGYHTEAEAIQAYDESFSDGSGPRRRGAVTEMTLGGFKDWVRSGDTTNPLAYKPTRSTLLKRREVERRRMMPTPREAPRTERAEPPGLIALRQRREAREEVESQPRIYEHEHAGPQKPAEAPLPKAPPRTTNKVNILSNLEKRLVGEEITPAEADRIYGRKEGGPGRDRRFNSLADYLRDRVKKLVDPETMKALVAEAKVVQEMPRGRRRDALSRALNERIAATDPERVEKLQQALHELEDPIGAEAEREREAPSPEPVDAKASLDAALRGLDESGDDIGKVEEPSRIPLSDGNPLRDPAVNHPVESLLGSAAQPSGNHGIAGYLDAVANAPRMPFHLRHLARILKAMLPHDLEVLPFDLAAARHPELSDYIQAHQEDTPGLYIGTTRAGTPLIALNPDFVHEYGAEAIVHEALHAATLRYIRGLQPGDRHYEVYQAIADELRQAYEAQKDTLGPQARHAIEHALGDFAELHTMLMTSPQVQAFAASLRPSSLFKATLARLGYVGTKLQSLWDGFVWGVRQMLGLPNGSRTVLAHALKPLTDITIHAYGRSERFAQDRVRMPADPELQQAARPLADAVSRMPATRAARRQVQRAIDSADIRGLGDRARRQLLSAKTTDGIVHGYHRLFDDPEGGKNFLERWRDATEAITGRIKEVRDNFSPRVSAIVKDMKGPERADLASLMNDATIFGARLGPDADNAHLKTPEQKTYLAKLQRRYQALTPKARSVYDRLRDLNHEVDTRERTAQLAAMIKRALPDITHAQLEKLTTVTKSPGAIAKFLRNPDDSELAEAFGKEWDSNRALVRGILNIHKQGYVPGDYFGLRRYGDYVITYGDKGDPDYGVEFFEKRNQADARRDQLEREKAKPSQVFMRRGSGARRDLFWTTALPDELKEAIERDPKLKGSADEVKDLFTNILLQHATRSAAARTRMRRHGVLGASTDIERVVANDFLAATNRIGYLEKGPDRDEAMGAMRRHIGFLERNAGRGDPITARQVYEELERRVPAGDDSSVGALAFARKASSFGYAYSLMSPSHWITSTMEAHANAGPQIGARHGFAKATIALGRALRDLTPEMAGLGARNTFKAVGKGLEAADWNLAHYARDRLIAQGENKTRITDLFDRLVNTGLVDHTQMREMYRIAHPASDLTHGWMDRFFDLSGAGQHAFDVLNKSAIATAAYRLEYARTGDHDAAVKYAIEMVRNSMPNYQPTNKPRISTRQGPLGGWASIPFQFKQYGLFMYSMLGNLVHTWAKGATKIERVEARRAFLGIMATHALMAGVITWLADPLRIVGGLHDLIFGEHFKNYDYEVRNFIAHWLGPELGEVVSRGLPHALGVDVHHRVGLSNLLELPNLDAPGDVWKAIGTALVGATGEDAAAFFSGIKDLFKGDVDGALRGVLPRLVRDPLKAYDLETTGLTNSRGQTILPPSKIPANEIVAQALGFQPAVVSEFREGREAVVEARQAQMDARSAAEQAFFRDHRMQAIRDYNAKYPESPITYSQIIRGLRQRTRLGPYGLRMSPRQSVGLTGAGAFANVP